MLTLVWVAYGNLTGIFKRDIPVYLKKKAFTKCVRLVITYGSETLTLTMATAKRPKVTHKKIKKLMLGSTLKYDIRIEDRRRRAGVNYVVSLVRKLK